MPTKQPERIDITLATFLRFFGVVALMIVAYFLLRVIAALFVAVIIASAIEPTIRRAKNFGVGRVVSVLVIYIVAAAVFVGLVYLVLPAVATELQNFIASYPIYQREIFREIQSFTGIPLYNLFADNKQELLVAAPEQLGKLAEGTLQFTVGIFGGVALAVITLVISFYLATQEKGIESFLRLISPLEYEEYVIDLWGRAQRKVGQWLRAQVLLGAIVGVLVYITLTLLGIRYSLVFAALAAVFEIIPVVGPILAAIPAVAIAFVQGPLLGLFVIIIYFVIQQIESHLVVPAVMRRAVGLNPLVVVVSLLIGGTLGGVVGLLLAVPIATVVVEFLTDTDRKKRGAFQYGGGGG